MKAERRTADSRSALVARYIGGAGARLVGLLSIQWFLSSASPRARHQSLESAAILVRPTDKPVIEDDEDFSANLDTSVTDNAIKSSSNDDDDDDNNNNNSNNNNNNEDDDDNVSCKSNSDSQSDRNVDLLRGKKHVIALSPTPDDHDVTSRRPASQRTERKVSWSMQGISGEQSFCLDNFHEHIPGLSAAIPHSHNLGSACCSNQSLLITHKLTKSTIAQAL
ncbi:hypothetical protein PoB_000572300 [Plakobranchus ocellatus]|uniref:Uncharacterized protein n=1 Tax=Plakobranchus ocellatus TaxID=259542 RepID=A0AAV3Y9N3_9GAST|nr:hypothetical protein PoB_000572300 [Plakobranchus ocellatus]